MSRKKIIAIRVTEAEKERAEQIAAELDMSISAYLRRCIKIAPAPQRPTKQAA